MSDVFYRKYRPQSFEDVIAQDHIVSILKHQIATKNLSHAYLFAGPRGTGKTTLARIFARHVNGLDKDFEIENIDIVEIDAASNRGIDEIRELKERVSFAPSSLKYKIYLIDEVHMLTKEAFNALLKTIEEPPSHVIFIFATTEAHKVPVTILSRVIRFDLKLANEEEIRQKLNFIIKSENIKVTSEALNIIIKQGRGSFRDSESIFEKIVKGHPNIEISEELVEASLGFLPSESINNFLSILLNSDLIGGLKLVKQMENSGANPSQFCAQILEKSRENIAEIIDNNSNDTNLKKFVEIIKEFNLAMNSIKNSLTPLLPIEIAIYNICKISNNVNLTANINTKPTNEVPIEKVVDLVQPKKENNLPKPDIESLKNNWVKIVNELIKSNSHLGAIFMKAQPTKIDLNKVIIEVPFEFHRKKLSAAATRLEVVQVIESIVGYKIEYEIIVNKDLAIDIAVADDQAIDADNKDIVEEIFSL